MSAMACLRPTKLDDSITLRYMYAISCAIRSKTRIILRTPKLRLITGTRDLQTYELSAERTDGVGLRRPPCQSVPFTAV